MEYKDKVDIDIYLKDEGKNKLNVAYKASSGKEFTVYCSMQMIYSFKVSKPIFEDAFSVFGVFDEDNGLKFINMIQNAPDSQPESKVVLVQKILDWY